MNPIIPAALSAGSSLFGSILGFNQQKTANRFNVDMWNRQNIYNSPAEQMKRLKSAGLNPNLIYGSGSGGATGNASDTPKFEQLTETAYKPVDIPSTMSSLQAFTDWDIKKATADRIRTQTELDKQRTLSEILEQTSTDLRNKADSSKLPYVGEIAKLSMDGLRLSLDKTLADTQYTKNQDKRANTQLQVNTMEAIQRIMASRSGINLNNAQISKLVQDTRLQKWVADQADSGISPNSPWYVKTLTDWIKKLSDKPWTWTDKNEPKSTNPNKPWYE